METSSPLLQEHASLKLPFTIVNDTPTIVMDGSKSASDLIVRLEEQGEDDVINAIDNSDQTKQQEEAVQAAEKEDLLVQEPQEPNTSNVTIPLAENLQQESSVGALPASAPNGSTDAIDSSEQSQSHSRSINVDLNFTEKSQTTYDTQRTLANEELLPERIILDSSMESSASSAEEDPSEQTSSPLTSSPSSECGAMEPVPDYFESQTSMMEILPELFAENITAKALRTAQAALTALPAAFPEIVPQESGHDGSYSLREADFWTCGFFPGTLYATLERLVKYPQSTRLPSSINTKQLREQLTTLCRMWSEPIRGMDGRTDTHDIGFIVMPALRADWELFGNPRSLDSIVKAARSLATRYVPSAQAIRSWDLLKKKDIEILDQEDNMIVIIDSMCNLDLLFYAAHHTQDSELSDMASAHASTLLTSHLRPEPVLSSSKDAYRGQWYSTCHVANIDPKSGALKRRLTAQGYEHDSTWSRGQAWGILGYAETYMWTKDRRFLEASCGLAEYFLYRLDTAPPCVTQGRHVPLWDFDAPIEDLENPLRDSSAGAIAANGMLTLSQALASIGQTTLSTRFRKAAVTIVQDTLSFALAPEKAKLVTGQYHQIRAEEVTPGCRYDGMLKFGTANNNVNARKRYANHGLVYGDYYLVEFGNRLLRMGLC